MAQGASARSGQSAGLEFDRSRHDPHITSPHICRLAGLLARPVQRPVQDAAPLGQHLVPAAAGVLDQVPAVVLGLGDVAVSRLLGLGQDAGRMQVGFVRRGTGQVTGAEHSLAQPG